MAARCTLSSSIPRGLASRAVSSSRCVLVRAEEPAKATNAAAPVPETPEAEIPPEAAAAPATMGSLMAFDGAAPELVNGRLAMLGFFAAVGAELSSGEGVIMQLKDAPVPVFATFALIAAASFIPLLKGKLPESRSAGPFTAAAEMLNGRAAMIGLVSLIGAEIFTSGKALL